MNAAAVNPSPDVVQALLDAGAELISTNAYRTVPVCVHPNPDYRDTIDLVDVLVSEDLGEWSEFWNFFEGEVAWALFAAAAYNQNPAVVQVLIDAGAEVDGRTPYDGVTPLMAAAGLNRNPDVVRTLIAAGADPSARMEGSDYPAYTALMAAAWYNPNPAVLQALLEAGADVHAATRDGWTALLYAVSRHYPELGDSELSAIVRQLLAAGADPHVRDAHGATALMHASVSGSNLEVVELLTAAGIEVDAQNDAGRSALMWAAAFAANPEVVELLLDLGADAALANDDAETAWDLIQHNGELRSTSAYRRLRDLRGAADRDEP